MRGKRGSITVEASIVMTAALFMTIFLFFMAAYFHDMHRLQALCTRQVWELRADIIRHQKETGKIDWEQWMEEPLFWRLSSGFEEEELAFARALEEACRMWFGNACSFSVELSAQGAAIAYEGFYHFPLQTGFDSDAGIYYQGSAELSGTEPEEWIRFIGGIVRGFGGEEQEDGD